MTGLLEAKKAKLRELQAQLDKQHELELGDKVLSSPVFAAHALACTQLRPPHCFVIKALICCLCTAETGLQRHRRFVQQAPFCMHSSTLFASCNTHNCDSPALCICMKQLWSTASAVTFACAGCAKEHCKHICLDATHAGCRRTRGLRPGAAARGEHQRRRTTPALRERSTAPSQTRGLRAVQATALWPAPRATRRPPWTRVRTLKSARRQRSGRWFWQGPLPALGDIAALFGGSQSGSCQAHSKLAMQPSSDGQHG